MLNYITTSGCRLLKLVPVILGSQLTAPAIFPSFETLRTNRALSVLKSRDPVPSFPPSPPPAFLQNNCVDIVLT